MPQDLHDHLSIPRIRITRKLEEQDGKCHFIFANKCNYDHNICMIQNSYTSDTQSLTHISRSVLHDCDMEKNRAPTAEKTQKVSKTRGLRFSNPVLLHFKIPGPCFLCDGTGILQSGTGKLPERTESNVSFVKGHLTGRKLTATQCRYYVGQEVKWTPCHKTYTTILSIPRIRITKKLEKQMENMSFYIRKQIQYMYCTMTRIEYHCTFSSYTSDYLIPGTVLAAAIHLFLSFPHLRRRKQMRIKKATRQVVLAHHCIHRCMSSHIRLQSHNSWKDTFYTLGTRITWSLPQISSDGTTSDCRTQFENECVTRFYDTFDVASLLLQRLFEREKNRHHQPSIKITVLHEPRSAHGCHAMAQDAMAAGDFRTLGRVRKSPAAIASWAMMQLSNIFRHSNTKTVTPSLCTLVLKLGYICSFASSACAIGENSKLFFTLTTWHKWLNDRKKYQKKK